MTNCFNSTSIKFAANAGASALTSHETVVSPTNSTVASTQTVTESVTATNGVGVTMSPSLLYLGLAVQGLFSFI